MPEALEATVATDLNHSLEDDLAPNFGAMDALMNKAVHQNATGTASE